MAGLEGQTIGGCRILRRLGGGGMGEVYLADQTRLKRQVAIKIVRPELEATLSGANLAERFAREAQAIAAMEHPHILPVYDYGEQDGLAYLVMAYAPNGSLQEALTPGHPAFRFRLPLTLELTGIILDQAAQALQHAHDRGLLHRDVKPANFLLRAGPDGGIHLLLADFGLAKFARGAANSGVYAGTAIYSAPEQIQRQATPASDQYSLAVMIYLLLAGRPPFSGGMAEVMLQQLQTPPPPMHTFNPQIPPEVDAVVRRALAKKPEERWPNMTAFAAAYHQAVAASEAPPTSTKATFAALAASAPTEPPGPPAPAAAPPQPGALAPAPVWPQPGASASAPAQPQTPGVFWPAQPVSPPAGAISPGPTAPIPRPTPTQVAQATPGSYPFAAPPQQQTTARESRFTNDSFVAPGPLGPPPVLPSSGASHRRRWLGFAGGLGALVVVIVLVVLVMNLLGIHPGGTPPSVNGNPGSTGTAGVQSPVAPGKHILSVQLGRLIDDSKGQCQLQIQQRDQTTTFSVQQDGVIDVVFTVLNDGNPKADAGAALLDKNGKVVGNAVDDLGQLTCSPQGTYSSFLSLQGVPPGSYAVGIFYTETDNLPQQPEVAVPVTIQA